MFFFFSIINLSHSYQTPSVSAGFPELLVKITFAFGKLWTFEPHCFQLPPVDSVKPLSTHSSLLVTCFMSKTRSLCRACSLLYLYLPLFSKWSVQIIGNACANYKWKWLELSHLSTLCLFSLAPSFFPFLTAQKLAILFVFKVNAKLNNFLNFVSIHIWVCKYLVCILFSFLFIFINTSLPFDYDY